MTMPLVDSTAPALIDEAAQAWLEARDDERRANARRIEAEQKIIALVGVKEEGSKTLNSKYFKVSTTGRMTRTLDQEKWSEIKGLIPEKFRPVLYKAELDLKMMRLLQSAAPAEYRMFASALTVKPAKTAVTVEIL